MIYVTSLLLEITWETYIYMIIALLSLLRLIYNFTALFYIVNAIQIECLNYTFNYTRPDFHWEFEREKVLLHYIHIVLKFQSLRLLCISTGANVLGIGLSDLLWTMLISAQHLNFEFLTNLGTPFVHFSFVLSQTYLTWTKFT
jgi:hypothetical protein